MKLNYPKLPLPDAPETIAFRVIDNILRSDDTISNLCNGNPGLYISWRGDAEDTFDPSVATCPFLRISPGGLGSSWETEGQHRMPMSIAIEAAVVGSDFDQIGNFWGAIRSALFPPRPGSDGTTARSDWVKAQTKAANISRGILTAPAYSIKADENTAGPRITRADGTLELVLLISTP
jgi:hypothetical protein